MPTNLVGKRLDALWNDEFKYAIRAAILGRVRDGDPDFEYTIRKIVDCRMICDFTDGAQAVNYVTSHDVGNYRSSRLYNFLKDPWRKRIFDYIARLVKLRTRSAALAVNDTAFIHVDLTPGRRVFA